jgi:hypothetical protein
MLHNFWQNASDMKVAKPLSAGAVVKLPFFLFNKDTPINNSLMVVIIFSGLCGGSQYLVYCFSIPAPEVVRCSGLGNSVA